MKFTREIKDKDGEIKITHHANTQEEADFASRYVSACVTKFNGMPIDVIESMPEHGVPGLAIECSNGLDAIEALEGILSIATEQSENSWLALRQRFIDEKKMRAPEKTH